MNRDPLDKEKFMEGNRQRWAVIFLVCGMGVLFTNIGVPGFDPTPYMQFLLAIGSLFILGSSADSWVKAYSVKSIRETQTIEETKRINTIIEDKSKPNNNIILDFKVKYGDDLSYAPLEWINNQMEDETFR